MATGGEEMLAQVNLGKEILSQINADKTHDDPPAHRTQYMSTPEGREFLRKSGVEVSDSDSEDAKEKGKLPRKQGAYKKKSFFPPSESEDDKDRQKVPHRFKGHRGKPLGNTADIPSLTKSLANAMGITNPKPLTGKEDQDTRTRWSSIMRTKFLVWPFELTGMDTVFQTTLTAGAYEEYKSFIRKKHESEEDFAKRVIEHFSKPPQLNMAEVTSSLRDISSRRIQKGESLEELYAVLKRDISRLNWPTEQANQLLVGTFIHSCPENHQAILRSHTNLTPDQTLSMAKRMGAGQTQEMQGPHTPQVFSASTPGTSSGDIKQLLVEAILPQQQQISSLKDQLEQLKLAKPSNGNKKGKSNQLNAIKDLTTKCQICGLSNHVAKDCYKRHEGPPNIPPWKNEKTNKTNLPEVNSCQLCDQPGHGAKECKTPRCYYCNGTDHLKSRCDKLRYDLRNRGQGFPRGNQGYYQRNGNRHYGPNQTSMPHSNAYPMHQYPAQYPPTFTPSFPPPNYPPPNYPPFPAWQHQAKPGN